MRKKTYADIVLEAQMLPYSQEGYSFYKEAAELGLRGRYLENLLYKEAHRDILEAQELMLQESFFAESASTNDFILLVEEAEKANESFFQKWKRRIASLIKMISTLISNYNEHAKQNKEKVDEILGRMRKLGNLSNLSISQEDLLQQIKTIWANKGDMAEAAVPASKQQLPGVGASDELKSYISFGLAQDYVNVVVEPTKRFNGVISLDQVKELLSGLQTDHPDYTSLMSKYNEMAKKATEGEGVKIYLTEGVINEIQSKVNQWLNSAASKAKEEITKSEPSKKEEAAKDEAKTEHASMDDLMNDEDFMEHTMIILEDAASAGEATKFGEQLLSSIAKYADLMRCTTKFKNAFLPFFLDVLDDKVQKEEPEKDESKGEA